MPAGTAYNVPATATQSVSTYDLGEGRGLNFRYAALNQGPIVLMIENHRSGFFWDLMKRCFPIREGLLRAGFTGGWLRNDGRRT